MAETFDEEQEYSTFINFLCLLYYKFTSNRKKIQVNTVFSLDAFSLITLA